ncbi:MAG TPA: serine hydrolase domain-containing protein, partial [Gemmatimonadaceae bacterium]|nr:serine hydrolase domain-containing protein [Gemmatimonadaceae bacterium]
MTPYTKIAMHAACCLALVAPIMAASGQARPMNPMTPGVDDSTVQRLIRERVDSRLTAGIVVGIIDVSGRRVFAYGKRAGPGSAPVDANTVFEIGSITKTFSTALLADMVKRGEVALDDPVARYLPATLRLRQNGRAITLLDLATQRSGLPAIPANMRPRDPDDPYADYAAPQFYEYLASFTPPRPPGTKYEYSNVGFGLLGHALSQRAGTSYEALVAQRILTPLGMTDTRITLSP